MSHVTLKNIKKDYGEVKVVKGIDLEITENEFVVLVGPSGCGKSTTLRMIAGLEEITDGYLYIGDRLVNNISPSERNIAMVFQNYALYPHMSVYENIAFSLRIKKLPKDEIDSKVRKAASVLGLEEYLQRKPKALSGGQRQRVAMGRAMVKDAEVFLFDEPLSNLDAKLRSEMRTEIKRRHLENKKTTIYVTHDQVEAMTLADRLVIMNDGNIEQIGTPINVFQKPCNKFVASFIGSPSMNFFELNVEHNGDNIFLTNRSQKFKLPVPKNKIQLIKERKTITMGLRPSDIFISTENDKIANEWKINGMVEVCEVLGKNANILFSIDDKSFMGEIMGSSMPEPKSTTKVAFNLNHIHLFDSETEEALG